MSPAWEKFESVWSSSEESDNRRGRGAILSILGELQLPHHGRECSVNSHCLPVCAGEAVPLELFQPSGEGRLLRTCAAGKQAILVLSKQEEDRSVALPILFKFPKHSLRACTEMIGGEGRSFLSAKVPARRQPQSPKPAPVPARRLSARARFLCHYREAKSAACRHHPSKSAEAEAKAPVF